MKKPYLKQLFLPLLILLSSLPAVIAARTGFQATDTLVEMMGRIFYPSVLMRSEVAQVGFYKFLYFFTMFAVVNWALGKGVAMQKKGDANDKNTKRMVGIVAFTFAAIAAFFMPASIALGTAGVITALLTNIIPFAVTGIALWFAFGKTKDDSPWWQHLFGLLAIIMAIVIINGYLAYLPPV